ncbi:MAG: UPF0758 domain-containing protein [Nitrospinota bacterium]
MKKWTHPGGKLRELGAESLTDAELLSILISIGTKGKSAEDIAQEILNKFNSFKGMANQPLEKFLQFIRDKIVHFYFGINYKIVWEVIKKRLPEIKSNIAQILKDMENNP